MEQFLIVSLGTGNKTAYNESGNRLFVPERFRSTIKAGDFCLSAVKHYSHTTKLDKDGNPELVDGKPVLLDQPFDRDEITMVGNFKTTTIAKHASTIYNGVADSIIAAEVKNMKKEYSLEDIEKVLN